MKAMLVKYRSPIAIALWVLWTLLLVSFIAHAVEQWGTIGTTAVIPTLIVYLAVWIPSAMLYGKIDGRIMNDTASNQQAKSRAS